jgi:hypothetical protein
MSQSTTVGDDRRCGSRPQGYVRRVVAPLWRDCPRTHRGCNVVTFDLGERASVGGGLNSWRGQRQPEVVDADAIPTRQDNGPLLIDESEFLKGALAKARLKG